MSGTSAGESGINMGSTDDDDDDDKDSLRTTTSAAGAAGAVAGAAAAGKSSGARIDDDDDLREHPLKFDNPHSRLTDSDLVLFRRGTHQWMCRVLEKDVEPGVSRCTVVDVEGSSFDFLADSSQIGAAILLRNEANVSTVIGLLGAVGGLELPAPNLWGGA